MDIKQFYKGKKVFITGHTGFKGSWLSFWLKEMGAEVTGYALEPEYDDCLFNRLELSKTIHHHVGDVCDTEHLQKTLADSKAEIVFHLAAQALVKKSYDTPVLTFQTNVMGSLNLLETVRYTESVKSLVYITSDKCYWNNEWVWGYRENDPLGGPDPYSASKACAEHVFKSYYLSYFKNRQSFGCGSTRAGNVIGGGDVSPNRIVPDIIRSLEKGYTIVLRNPNATRPWQHVLDPLHGYLILGKHLYENPTLYNGEAWNFGPSNQSIKTVFELTNLLTKQWGDSNINIEVSKEKFHEAGLLHLSIDKAQTLLKWSPKYHFEESVKKTGEWYKMMIDRRDPALITREQIKLFMRDYV